MSLSCSQLNLWQEAVELFKNLVNIAEHGYNKTGYDIRQAGKGKYFNYLLGIKLTVCKILLVKLVYRFPLMFLG